MPLKDFAEFLEPLTPVYKGKSYPLPPVGVADAMPLMQTLEPGDFMLPDTEFERILLGEQIDRMREDNVPAVFIRHVFTCAIVDFTHGREAAEARYDEGPEAPKVPEPQTGAVDSLPSTSTGEANGTPSPASSSSTTTSRPSSPRKAKPASPSAGPKSSSSGRSSKRASTPSSASTS